MTIIGKFKSLSMKIMKIEKFRISLNFNPFMQYADYDYGK